MVLEHQGFCALAAYSADEAIKLLKTMDVALILSDVNMPGVDRVELALEARKVCPRTRILLMPGIETSETIKHRLDCGGGPFQVLAKPFASEQLIDRIEKLFN